MQEGGENITIRDETRSDLEAISDVMVSVPDLVVDGVPQQNVLALPMQEAATRGTVVFHDALNAKGY